MRRWRSPRTGIDYPVAFAVDAGDVDITLEPLMNDQELDSRASVGTIYWEGAVRAFAGGREIGRGYLELTGYGGAVEDLGLSAVRGWHGPVTRCSCGTFIQR